MPRARAPNRHSLFPIPVFVRPETCRSRFNWNPTSTSSFRDLRRSSSRSRRWRFRSSERSRQVGISPGLSWRPKAPAIRSQPPQNLPHKLILLSCAHYGSRSHRYRQLVTTVSTIYHSNLSTIYLDRNTSALHYATKVVSKTKQVLSETKHANAFSVGSPS